MSSNPPGIPRNNALTRAMDMVQQYNATYTPRALGGMGVPETEFVAKPQEVPLQPSAPMPAPQNITPEEAQRRLLAWAAESGQVLDPNNGNVVARVPVQPAPYGTNPGVIRRPEPVSYGYPPQGGYGPVPMPMFPAPQPVAAPPPRVSLTPMSIQSIQSIDFERSVVWADGTPFQFDAREAQPVLQFALEVILRQFAVQFGSLLQRYGFVQGASGVSAMHEVPAKGQLPPGQQQALGAAELLQAMPRGDAAGVPAAPPVPSQVPGADAAGTQNPSGDSAPTT